MPLILFISMCFSENANWWEKPRVQRNIAQHRQIYVTLKKTDQEWSHLEGVGQLRLRPKKALKRLLKFERYPDWSSHFKKVKHDQKNKRVSFQLSALGYETKLKLKYNFTTSTSGGVVTCAYHWTVEEGAFQGMIGSINFKKVSARQSEIFLKAKVKNENIPLPGVFKTFVLESLIQQVATRFRRIIEA